MTTPITKVGDVVHLTNFLTSNALYGVVCDEDTPQMMSMTMEVVGGEAVITTPVLVGRTGDKGDNAPIVQLHFIEGLTTFDDALTKLPDWDSSMANHGVWLVDDADNPTKSLVYVWDGSEWHHVLPGPAGPAGATPDISMEFHTIPMDERGPGVEETVEVSGTVLQPHFTINALTPQGEPGPAAAIDDALDYDGSGGKDVGDALTVLPNGKWGPSTLSLKVPRLYTIPEGAFQSTPNFIGIGPTDFAIGSYVIPAQDFDWIPYVTGHIKAVGLELDEDPTEIGCIVKVAPQSGGGMDGDVVARGKGNSAKWTTIVPHFSSGGDPNRAVAPGNDVGVINAGISVRVNAVLHNDGIASWYSFSNADAQLSVLVVPAGGPDSDYESGS